MQTFITDFDMHINAKNLDNKRLGKQRVEALQIADCLLIKVSRWKFHPATAMWKNYEAFLLHKYVSAIFLEWKNRGFKNYKCEEWYEKLNEALKIKYENKFTYQVDWINKSFIESHRSNLIKKDFNFYRNKFPSTLLDLPYIWPVENIKFK